MMTILPPGTKTWMCEIYRVVNDGSRRLFDLQEIEDFPLAKTWVANQLRVLNKNPKGNLFEGALVSGTYAENDHELFETLWEEDADEFGNPIEYNASLQGGEIEWLFMGME